MNNAARRSQSRQQSSNAKGETEMTTNWKALEAWETRVAFAYDRGDASGEIGERAGQWFVAGWRKSTPAARQSKPITEAQARSAADQLRKIADVRVTFDGFAVER